MLTTLQISCIILLLQAFGVDPSIVATVQSELVATQATSVVSNSSEILDSSISPVDSTIATQSTPAIIPVMNPLEVYASTYEDELKDLYFWGNNPLLATDVSVSQNGSPIASVVAIASSHDQGANCINVQDATGNVVKKCGGTSMRFTFSPELIPGSYDVVLGQTYTSTFTVLPPTK